MRKHLAAAVGLTLALSAVSTTARADVFVSFDGRYEFGVFDWWRTATDWWGDPLSPTETSPGRGGSGSAQTLTTHNGNHYVYKTMAGLVPGLDYEVSVWIRTYFANATTGDPGPNSWVEFGWDAEARDSTSTIQTWCVEPKFDFASSMGQWTQYTGEPFQATSDSVTIAFKVGSVDLANGIRADFDDLSIVETVAQIGRYPFPDTFDTTYTFGVAHGWLKRFLPGGVTPRWEEAAGRAGSAQRLYAGTETENLAVSIGVVKLFEVVPGNAYELTLWINASDSFGSALADVNTFDPGPIVKFGPDLTAQLTSPSAPTILWNTDPTDYFSTSVTANTWKQFTSSPFWATSDTVSVWLWVEGDYFVGVDASFDDLDATLLSSALDAARWKEYR